MKTLMTTSLTAMLLAGAALMAAQTGNTPAPAANSSSTTAPAKVKKHHHKSNDQFHSGCGHQIGPGQHHACEVSFEWWNAKRRLGTGVSGR